MEFTLRKNRGLLNWQHAHTHYTLTFPTPKYLPSHTPTHTCTYTHTHCSKEDCNFSEKLWHNQEKWMASILLCLVLRSFSILLNIIWSPHRHYLCHHYLHHHTTSSLIAATSSFPPHHHNLHIFMTILLLSSPHFHDHRIIIIITNTSSYHHHKKICSIYRFER